MNPTALTPAHLGEAYAIAAEVHKDKVGKDERPYFEHVYEVARRAGKQYDRLQWNAPWQRLQVQIEAVLHDAIEDFKGTTVEKAMLRERIRITFGEWCGWALDRLTHRRGESYEDYIERVAAEWDTRLVKMCDISHNLEAWRLPRGLINDRFFEQRDQYHRAFVRLMRED